MKEELETVPEVLRELKTCYHCHSWYISGGRSLLQCC